MENRKIKNATTCECDGIYFKSYLEKKTYKALKDNGLKPEYEGYRFILQDSKKFSVPVYMPYYDKKEHKDVFGLYPYKVLSIKYTPDFVVKKDGIVFIIECKGFKDAGYPYRMKLFLEYLEKNLLDSVFMEIHNEKQLEKAIEIIKQWKENH